MLPLIFLFAGCSVGLLAWQLLPPAAALIKRWQYRKSTQASEKLNNIFIWVEDKRIAFLYLILPVLGGAAALLVTGHLLGMLGGLFAGLLIPELLFKMMVKSRRLAFNRQLVDGMMIVSSSLKAGLSLTQAFESLVEEMPAPISQEFGLLVKEGRMGIPLEETLERLKKRMPLAELELILTAIAIAQKTGGSLPRVFSQVISTIREREKLQNRVKALCVQGKIQGIGLSVIPVAFIFIVKQMNPNFFNIMLESELGRFALLYCLLAWIVGVVLIRKFSRVEV